MNTTMVKEGVLNKTISAPNDELLMEELKGYFNNKLEVDDEREELGDEDEDNDNDERKELGDDEDDDFEEEDDSDYDDDDDLEDDNEDEIDEDED